MNFHIKKPCDNCPFLKVGGIRLNEQRAIEIIGQIQNEGFICHKTTHGKMKDRKQCGGSMILCEKENLPNTFTQLHERLLQEKPKLLGKELVVDSTEEFINLNRL